MFRNEDTDVDLTEDDIVKRVGTSVYFYSDVSKSSVFRLIQCIHEATQCSLEYSTKFNTEPHIELFIHSHGGCSFSGLSAMDHIMNNRVPITTCADGIVASAATFLLLAGSHRVAMRHSYILIHQLSVMGFEGKYMDMIDEMENSHGIMNTFREIYKSRTNMGQKRVDQLLKKELILDSNLCLQEGFVHELRPDGGRTAERTEGGS